MTVGGYNMGGDLDICARETDKAQFITSAKKLAATRNVSERTIWLWCYQRSQNAETMERISRWLREESHRWYVSLEQFEILEESSSSS